MRLKTNKVSWKPTHRIIESKYPPIDLFEDISNPEDWLLLASFESKTNPRLLDGVGDLALVPPHRRVGGAGSSYVMAPFVHVSPHYAGRFHDGSFGGYYAANCIETALLETIHHKEVFCSDTNQAEGWISKFRELVGSIDTELIDIRSGDYKELLEPNDYTKSQDFAKKVRKDYDGIVYPSIRHKGGECFVAFYPDVISIPIQGRHYSYHWNGNRIDMIKELSSDPKTVNIPDNKVFKIIG